MAIYVPLTVPICILWNGLMDCWCLSSSFVSVNLINWNVYQVIFTKSYTLRSGRIMQGAYAANQIIDALLAFSDRMQIQVTPNL